MFIHFSCIACKFGINAFSLDFLFLKNTVLKITSLSKGSVVSLWKFPFFKSIRTATFFAMSYSYFSEPRSSLVPGVNLPPGHSSPEALEKHVWRQNCNERRRMASGSRPRWNFLGGWGRSTPVPSGGAAPGPVWILSS